MNSQPTNQPPEGRTEHELKIWPEYFDDVESGKKNFEVRKLDRLFATGDILYLREWSPIKGYSGRETRKIITYRMNGGQWGLSEGNCILGIATPPATVSTQNEITNLCDIAINHCDKYLSDGQIHHNSLKQTFVSIRHLASTPPATIIPDKKDRGCPCLYLDEPCHPMCTCKNGASSLGCMYCATYGSLEQRTNRAKLIAKKLSTPTVIKPLQWVKASDRLGDFMPSDIPEWLFFHPDFCKVDGKPAERPFFRKDISKGECVFSYIYITGSDFSEEIPEKEFNRIKWLDESTPPNQLSGIEVEEIELFKKLWYSRNPVHENNADTGEDMFWKTAIMVAKEFKAGYAASEAKPSGIDVLGVVDILNNWVNENGNRETIPRKAFLEIAKIISSSAASEGEEAIGFAEWCEENYCRHMSSNWIENKNEMNVAIKNSDLFSTSDLYNLYKQSKP